MHLETVATDRGRAGGRWATRKRRRSGPVSRVLVPPLTAGDDHLSRTPITRRLKRSTRESVADRTGPRDRPVEKSAGRVRCSLFDLAPGGVCLAKPVTRPAGEPLPHRFTLTAQNVTGRRFAFCCTFPGLTTGGCYPPPCPTVPGLSSRRGLARADQVGADGASAGGRPVHSWPPRTSIPGTSTEWAGSPLFRKNWGRLW